MRNSTLETVSNKLESIISPEEDLREKGLRKEQTMDRKAMARTRAYESRKHRPQIKLRKVEAKKEDDFSPELKGFD